MGIHDFFIVYLIGAVAGGYYLCKIKKEWILLLLLTFFWGSTAFFNEYVEERLKCSLQNMESALRQCALMLKAGQQSQLHEKLAVLLGSSELKTRNAEKVARAFAEAMGVVSVPEKKMPSIYWGIIWVSLVIGWYLLYHFRLKLIVRRGYLATVTILALVVLCLVYASNGVWNGYSFNGFRRDIELLEEAASGSPIQPELLPMLENPEMHSFMYLRYLPKISVPPKQ